MRATGTIGITRHPDGSTSYQWMGGDIVAIEDVLARELWGAYIPDGQEFRLGPYRLRSLGYVDGRMFAVRLRDTTSSGDPVHERLNRIIVLLEELLRRTAPDRGAERVQIWRERERS